jgi:hypothetical protein
MQLRSVLGAFQYCGVLPTFSGLCEEVAVFSNERDVLVNGLPAKGFLFDLLPKVLINGIKACVQTVLR